MSSDHVFQSVAVAMESVPLERVAANIRRLRRQKGWSQEMLAYFADLHPTAVSRIERGLRDPRFLSIVRITTALGVSMDELLIEIPEEKT